MSVDVTSPLIPVTDEGLNKALTPFGKTVVMLNGDVQELLLLPLKETVMV